MKTTKLISILIFLAILSFSCGEDEVKDEDIQTQGIAADYMFQENKTYTYSYVFSGLDISDSIYHINKFNFFSKEFKKNEEAMKYNFFNGEDTSPYLYYYTYGSKIFGLDNYFNLIPFYEDFIEKDFKWLLSYDFENEKFKSDYEYIHIGTENFDTTLFIMEFSGLNLEDGEYEFEGKKYPSKVFEIKHYIFSETKKDGILTERSEEFFIDKKIYFLKGIGIVQEDNSIHEIRRYPDNDSLHYRYEMNVKLLEIK